MKSLYSKSVSTASPSYPSRSGLSHRVVASRRLICNCARPSSTQEERLPSSDVSPGEIRMSEVSSLSAAAASHLQAKDRRDRVLAMAAVASTSLALAATAAPALASMGTASDVLYGAFMDMGLTIPGAAGLPSCRMHGFITVAMSPH